MRRLLKIISIVALITIVFVGCSDKSKTNNSLSSNTYENDSSVALNQYSSSKMPEIEIPDSATPSLNLQDGKINYDTILNNIEIPDSISKLNESEIKIIYEKQEDLFSDLTTAFNNAGIKVDVNKDTGEIAMDSTVLFGGDSAELMKDGKEFLNKFVKAYTSIIYNKKYDGFISKTIVEGHIAPISGTTYEGGLPLSEKRAENVMNYCLSKDTGVDTTKLAGTMETIGYSQSKPLYDDEGNVDIEGSRRVSFRFIINIDD